MKILFISQYYPPEIGAAANRIGYFARFLAKAGHDVSVLTSAPNYPGGKIYEGYKNRFAVSDENGVKVYRTRIFLSAKSNAISRLAHYLSFVISSVIKRKKIEKPDVIFASSPPLFTAFIGVIFKKLWHVPLVTDIRDIWPESVESVGAVKNKRLLKQGEKLALWIYKNSDRITATSPGIKNKIVDLHGAPAEKIEIMPNGAELDLFQSNGDGENIRRTWNLGKKFVVLYTGNIGLAQAPEIFIKTAELLREENDIIFLIVGAGVSLPKLEKEARGKNLTNIIFAGNQPRIKMPSFIAAADICIIPYKKADTFRNTLPSKMFDYMAGGKPVIINLKGEASQLIEQAGCGLAIKEEDAKSLADALIDAKERGGEWEQMGPRGRIFVEKNYQREKIAEDLSGLLNRVI